MTIQSQPQPSALVLTESPAVRKRQTARLEQDGYLVRCFETAWDALAIFGQEMPELAVIAPVRRTPCLDLLMEDLRRYGVPVICEEPRAQTPAPGNFSRFSRSRARSSEWHHA